MTKGVDAVDAAKPDLPSPSPEELLHELLAHQIELEMQNEALRDAQVALEESRDRYMDLYEFAPAGYLSLTPSGAISKANLTAATLLRLDRKQILLTRFDRLVQQEDRARWTRNFMDIKARGGHGKLELAMAAGDGLPLYLQVDCARQRLPGEAAPGTSVHDPIEVRVTLTDITQRKQAEMAMRDSEARYHSLFDASHDAIFVVSDSAMLMVNPAGLRLLGIASQEQVLGRDLLEFIHPDYHDLLRKRANRCLVQGLPNPPVESRFVRLDGDLVDVESISVPVEHHGAVVLLIVARDITDRKNADRSRRETQRERRANAQRLAEMSRHLVLVQEEARRRLARELHDRTKPNLAAIGINLEVAVMALQEREWEEVAVRMEDSRALVLDTVESIREICTDLRPPALDYAGLLPALESYATQYFRRTGIAVRLDCTGLEARTTPDLESTLFRIFQEAMTNSAKHARATTVEVLLQVDEQSIRLEVADDGCGFDPASPGAVGSLGIVNMREMAEFSSGSFELHSSPGAGTRVRVAIPAPKPMP